MTFHFCFAVDIYFNLFLVCLRFNDAPHGQFGILYDRQMVTVQPGTLKRHLQLNVTRSAGTFGRVSIY